MLLCVVVYSDAVLLTRPIRVIGLKVKFLAESNFAVRTDAKVMYRTYGKQTCLLSNRF